MVKTSHLLEERKVVNTDHETPNEGKAATPQAIEMKPLYRFVLRRVRDREAAEDIVQEVLVKAYSRQGTLKEPSKLRPWLYQITRNAIVDYYRLRRPAEAVPNNLIHDDIREEGNRAQRELARCLVPLLDELPHPYRQALTLAEFEGATQREVASRLGLSLSGAKSRVQRARKMLRGVLLECCRVELDRRGGVVDYETREAVLETTIARHYGRR
jgi:RNA polymerase sigma-70 factor (ECF subfamily)